MCRLAGTEPLLTLTDADATAIAGALAWLVPPAALSSRSCSCRLFLGAAILSALQSGESLLLPFAQHMLCDDRCV